MLGTVTIDSGRSSFSVATNSGSGVVTASVGRPLPKPPKAANSFCVMCSGVGAPIPTNRVP